ncbi:hypothetical protein C4585_00515 [Candidatus Parcubacteria bacterium]|nr:MAG: hypothetical protein C4585_00515 [Candidatus Parcubacteria bacterium]
MQYLIALAFVIFVAVAGYLVNQNIGEQAPVENTVSEGNTVEESNNIPSGRTLDLSGQGLTKVPESVFKETNLEELNLSNNTLEGALQAEIRHLQRLKVLDISNNKFTGVPAEIGQLKDLEILDLSNNQLTGLPYELGNLSKLKVLDLSGNAYSEADLSLIKQSLPPSTIIKVD